MKNHSINPIRLTILTCASAFILGYLNAHGLLFNIGVMVSPQTGNLANMGVSLGQGDFPRLFDTLCIFGGFLLGCFIATALEGVFKNKKHELVMAWSIFALPIVGYYFFIDYLPYRLIITMLSFISGVALCFFRMVGKLEINNSIVTGNMRFMSRALYEVIYKKDKSKYVRLISFTMVTFLFFFGALVVSLLSFLGIHTTLLLIAIITSLFYKVIL